MSLAVVHGPEGGRCGCRGTTVCVECFRSARQRRRSPSTGERDEAGGHHEGATPLVSRGPDYLLSERQLAHRRAMLAYLQVD
jgi:hypothetical protein